jgi:hypothetical protein
MIPIDCETPETALACLYKLLKVYPESEKLIKEQIQTIHSVIETGEAYDFDGSCSVALLIDIECIEQILNDRLTPRTKKQTNTQIDR